jgi:hypothetical protein
VLGLEEWFVRRVRVLVSSLLPLVAALAGVVSCATGGKSPGPDRGEPTALDYAPLAVGASWTYALNFQGQTGERTVSIVAEKDGYFVDSEKGELRHTREGLRDRSRYLVRHPLRAGESWKAVLSASAVERYRIVSVSEPCESLAGRFDDCLVVEATVRRDAEVSLQSRFVWARGVGLVKIETAVELAGKGLVPQTSQSLVRYTQGARSKPAGASGGGDDGPDSWSR